MRRRWLSGRIRRTAGQARFGVVAAALVAGGLVGLTANRAVAGTTTWYASAVATTSATPCTGTAGTSAAEPCGLQQAITAAADGDRVMLADGTYDGTFSMTGKAVDLTATDPGQVTIDAGGQGSALYIDGASAADATTLTGITFSDGNSQGSWPNGGNGGGIDIETGTVTLTDSTVTDNTASSYGGGVYNDMGQLQVIDSTISDNSAALAGGGLYSGGLAYLTESSVVGNTAGQTGGGIDNLLGEMSVETSTIQGNVADQDGGGIEDTGIYSDSLTVTQSTIVDNQAPDGGAANISATADGATLAATILARPQGGGGDCLGETSDLGYNIDDDGSCNFTAPTSISGTTTDAADTTYGAALDAWLGTVGYYGSTRPTVPLLRTPSTSTTAPDPAYGVIPAAFTLPSTWDRTTSVHACGAPDENGNPRKTVCDIGAFELPGPPAAPDLTATGGDGTVSLSWTTPDDEGSPITDYVIDEYSGSSASGTPTVIDPHSTTADHTVEGLADGQDYTFTVAAVNSVGTGTASAAQTATTTAPASAPSTPTGVSAVGGNGEVTLSWQAPSGEPTDYLVNEYQGESTESAPTVIDTESSTAGYTVTGLTNDQTYTFTVEAGNGAGDSSASSPVTTTPEAGDTASISSDVSDGAVPLVVHFDFSHSNVPDSSVDHFDCGGGAVSDDNWPTATCTYLNPSIAGTAGYQATLRVTDDTTGTTSTAIENIVANADVPDPSFTPFDQLGVACDGTFASEAPQTGQTCSSASGSDTEDITTPDGDTLRLTAAPGSLPPGGQVQVYSADPSQLQANLGSNVQVAGSFAVTWTPDVPLTSPLVLTALVPLSASANVRYQAAGAGAGAAKAQVLRAHDWLSSLGNWVGSFLKGAASVVSTVWNAVTSPGSSGSSSPPPPPPSIGEPIGTDFQSATQVIAQPNGSLTNNVFYCSVAWQQSAGEETCPGIVTEMKSIPTSQLASFGAPVIAAGGANVIAAGGANVIAAGGANVIAAGGANVIAAGGANVIAAGGANVIAAGGANVINAGGANIVARPDLTARPSDASDDEATLTIALETDPAFGFVTPANPNPPTVTATTSPSNVSGPISGPVTVHLSATPGGSAVTALHYSLSGAESSYQSVAGSQADVVIDTPGTTTLTYWAEDADVNESAAQSLSVTINSSGSSPPVSPGPTTATASSAVGDPSATQPLVATVTDPAGGPITFGPATGSGLPTWATPVGLPMTITAPTGSVSSPLQLVFRAFGVPTSGRTQVYRDGSPVQACTGTGASPDPCLASETTGAGITTFVVLSSHASTWALGNVAPVAAVRVGGSDRDATAVAISAAHFAKGSAGAVVLARNDDYPDALAGGPLAAALKAPLLLTSSTALDPHVAAEISRVLPAGGSVYLLGGPAALSDAVQTAVGALGYKTTRMGGTDRYQTASNVADLVDHLLGGAREAFEVTGTDFADALTAVPAAVAGNGVILLTAGSSPSPATTAWLSSHPGLTRYAVGGPAAQADPSATPVVGADRYATAAAVASRFFPTPTALGVATGGSFADAVAAGPVVGGPLMLVPPQAGVPVELSSYLAGLTRPPTVTVFGGPSAVGGDALTQLEAALP